MNNYEERTLSIIKPDAVERNLENNIKNFFSNNNLRIVKSNEQKPEIKKVKVQDTEKREFKIKDYVVYPKHGVGQINEIKKINIGGINVEAYVLKFEKNTNYKRRSRGIL